MVAYIEHHFLGISYEGWSERNDSRTPSWETMSNGREGSEGQQVLPVAACLNLSPFAWLTFPCCAVRLRQCWFLPLTENMDFSKEGCRFYTFTRWKLGKKAMKIRRELLLQVFPESTPSLETVSRWIRAFATGKTQLEDDHRSGRPRTSVTETTTVRARAIIDEDPTVTLRFLSLEQTSTRRVEFHRIPLWSCAICRVV